MPPWFLSTFRWVSSFMEFFFCLENLVREWFSLCWGIAPWFTKPFHIHCFLCHLTKSLSCAGQTGSPRSERWGNRVREERTCPDHHRLGNATFTLVQCSRCSAITCQTDSRDVFKAFYSLCLRIPWTEKPCGLQSKGFQRVERDWAEQTAIRKT